MIYVNDNTQLCGSHFIGWPTVNPDHALNGNNENELETPELELAKKAPKQNDFDYSVQKTGEKLGPIFELVEKFEKKKKQVKN